MDDVVKQVLGPVSAYALAKQQGYSGTLEEWAQDQANAGANAAAAKKSAEDAAAILEQIKENNKSYDEEINKLKALKPEDIGAQPAGDYALKNEIPAPYTLPTATADTLGGVKSSEAVTVNADGTMTVNQLNGKDAKYYSQPRNLLDNSGFEVAQAGYGGYHGSHGGGCDGRRLCGRAGRGSV